MTIKNMFHVNSKHISVWFTLALALALWLPASQSAMAQPKQPPIKICDDNNYAPFVYSDGVQTWGATASLVDIIFKNLKLDYTISIMPWQRCKAYVKNNTFDMALDVAFETERLKYFTYSLPYYQLTPKLFFLRSKYPAGLQSASARQLDKLQGCGLHGFSYARYGLDLSKLDTGSADYADVIRKTRAGLCDYFLAEDEIIRGNALPGPSQLNIDGLSSSPVSSAGNDQLYFFFGRTNPKTQWLVPLINQQIQKIQQNGTMRQLVRQALTPQARPH